MRLETRLFAGVTFGMAAAAAACFAVSMWFASTVQSENLRSLLVAESISVQGSIDAQAQRATSMAQLVATMPPVIEAFETRDRDALAAMTVPGFDTLREQEGIAQYQFHLEPATSFLRVHRPARFGDDLSGFRHTVVQTNRTENSVSGVEVGVAGLGIRGIQPVFSGGRHIGSVEFGISMNDAFVDAHTERTGTMIEIQRFQNGEATLIGSSLPDGFELSADDRAAGFREDTIIPRISLGGVQHAMLIHPLRDFSGNPVGVVVIAIDRTRLDSNYRTFLTVFGILCVVILIAGLALAWAMNRSCVRPLVSLKQTLEALGRDETGVEIYGVGRKDEIGEIAGAVEDIKQNTIRKAEEDRRRDEERAQRQAEERKQMMTEMAVDFESAVGSIVTSVAAASKQMEQAARGLTQSSAETSRKASTVSSSSDEASANVQTVAAAAEELAASISEISQQVVRSNSMADQARGQASDTVAKVSEMSEVAQRIGDIVTLIQQIAEQTNCSLSTRRSKPRALAKRAKVSRWWLTK